MQLICRSSNAIPNSLGHLLRSLSSIFNHHLTSLKLISDPQYFKSTDTVTDTTLDLNPNGLYFLKVDYLIYSMDRF